MTPSAPYPIRWLNHMLLLLAALLSSCGGGRDCIEGSGTITTDFRTVPEFTRVELGGGINMVIRRADTQSVRVEGDDNLVEHVDTDVEGDKLVAGYDGCYESDDPITVYVTWPDVRGVQLSGSGTVRSADTITTPSLAVRMNGSGTIDLTVAAHALRTQGLGSGNINLHGSSITHDIVLDGSGSVEASDLMSDRTTITSNGSGSITVTVNRELHATVTGSGSVRYHGNPTIVDVNTPGSGRVTSDDDGS